MEEIYKKLNFPNSTLVNKVIEKEKIINNPNVDVELKEIFEKYVNNVEWKYSLKGSILNIPTFYSINMQYSEVEIFEISINNNLCIYDIALAFGRCIQYPVILFIKKDNKFKIGTYYVRENKKDYTKNVVQDIVYTGWFEYSNIVGRMKNILNEMHIEKLTKSNIYEFYKNIQNIIIKNHSSYYERNDVVELFNKYKLNDEKHNFNDFCSKCESIKVDENTLNKFDWMRRSKLEKYKENYNKSNLMFCKDEIFNYIECNYSNKGFKDFSDFIRQTERIKKVDDIKKSKSNNVYKCFWNNGGKCENSKSNMFDKYCKTYTNCLFYKKEKITLDSIPNYIAYSKNEELDKEYNNVLKNFVEYGDTVEISDNEKNLKRFVIIKNNSGIIPAVPKLCIDRRINDTFLYKGKEYKIINIIKNQNIPKDKKDENNDIPFNENSFVEINDKVEVIMKYTYGKERKEKCTKIEFTIRDDVISSKSYMSQICLNKDIGFKFRVGKNECEIVNIYKGRLK